MVEVVGEIQGCGGCGHKPLVQARSAASCSIVPPRMHKKYKGEFADVVVLLAQTRPDKADCCLLYRTYVDMLIWQSMWPDSKYTKDQTNGDYE